MTQAITVGFAPAGASALGLATPAAAGQPAGESGLFAALLALLAPGVDPTTLTEQARAGLSQLQAGVPAESQQQLRALAGKLGIDLAELAKGTALEDVIAGLAADTAQTDSGAPGEAIYRLVALLAPEDSTESYTSAPPLEAAEVEHAIEALLAALDVAPPAPPSVTEEFSQVVGQITEAIVGSQTPDQRATAAPAAPAPTAPGATPAPTARAQAATVPAAEPPVAPLAAEAIPAPELSPALQKLARIFEDAARTLEASNPQLAGKLADLARTIPALPDDVIAALDERLPADTAELADGLERLVERLVADNRAIALPRPQPVPPAFTQPLLAVAPAGQEADEPQAGPDLATRNAPRAEPADEPSSPPPSAPRVDPPRSTAGETAAARPNPAAPTAPADGEAVADELQPTTQAASPAATPPPATAPAALRAVQAAYQPPLSNVVIPQVAFEIARQFEAGNSRFQIRLDPPELGRIDVRLDMDRGGSVHARLTVERPETLDLMQRDQRALHQALQQAGLDSSRTSLEFSLRQNPFAGEGFGDGRQDGRTAQGNGLTSSEGGSDPGPEIYRGAASAGALNLFV